MAGCGVNKNHRPHQKFRPPRVRDTGSNRQHANPAAPAPAGTTTAKEGLGTDAIQTSVRRVCGDDTRNALLGAHREVQRSSSGVSTAIRSRLGVAISLHTFIRPKALGFADHEANDRLADSGEKKAYRAVMEES